MNPSIQPFPAHGDRPAHVALDLNPFFIAAVWLLMAWLVNPVGNFPLNDDWVYSLAVKSVLANGYYHFPSPSSANVGPQVYWGALFCLPFGFSFTALRLSTLVLGLLGVWSFYGSVKLVTRNAAVSLVAAVVLAVNPLYFSLANSFMTDVPFIAVVLIALYFLMRGFNEDSSAFMATGLAFALLSILIRQFGFALVAGFSVAYVVRYGAKPVNLIKAVAMLALGLAVHFAYQYWLVHTGRTPFMYKHSDPGQLLPKLETLIPILKTALNALLYIGFFVFPFLAVRIFGRNSEPTSLLKSTPTHLPTKARRVWPYVVCGVLVFAALWHFDKVLPDNPKNSLTVFGLGPLTLRDTFILGTNYPDIPGAHVAGWTLVRVISIISAAAAIYWLLPLLGDTFSKLRRFRAHPEVWPVVLVLVTLALSIGIVCLVTNRVPIFDRYFLIAAPLIILLLVMGDRPVAVHWTAAGKASLAAILVAYAAFTVAVTHDYLAWNRARWAATDQLTQQQNVPADRIDGGYEFNGWFLNRPDYRQRPGYSFWYVGDDEYVIASGPLPSYEVVAEYPFQRWFLFRQDHVLVLRRKGEVAR